MRARRFMYEIEGNLRLTSYRARILVKDSRCHVAFGCDPRETGLKMKLPTETEEDILKLLPFKGFLVSGQVFPSLSRALSPLPLTSLKSYGEEVNL
jgi:hypothetical protein